MTKFNENGRSMVEMLGVLAIIGVLSAGGLAGYSKAMFKHKLNSTMDQITMLVTNIRTMYGSQGNYDGLAANVTDLGIIPPVMGSTPSALTNPFKGQVKVLESKTNEADVSAVGAALGSSATAFVVTYEGLPKEACIALATADFGSGAGSGFIGVTIGANATNVVGTNEGQPYQMGGDTGAIKLCSDQGENATVSWKFY